MKKAILCVLLTLSMSVNAFALEVPTDTVVQNLNGSQQAIKTYTIPPEQDPATLIEEPFELEGFLYTFANIIKTENPIEESKVHTEVITIETAKKDLSSYRFCPYSFRWIVAKSERFEKNWHRTISRRFSMYLFISAMSF